MKRIHRPNVRRVLTALWALVSAATAAASYASAQSTARLARVEGMAYDSLAKRPLRDAFISVVGTSRSTTSDEKGRFRLDSVPEGQQQFTMQHAAFDSLGLSGVSARVMVQPKTPKVVLAVPSFETLWRAACGEVPAPRDSALVYGTVRDAVGGLAQAGALVDVSWIDLVGGGSSLASIGQRRWRRQSITDARGEFALCGVPAGTPLTLRAALDSADTLSVSALELEATTVRVRRRDVLVSRVVAAPAVTGSGVARDSMPVAPTAATPTGVVIGLVTNAAGAPIANAAIAVETMAEVRSGEDGRFMVRDVPAGSRQVTVVSIGLQPYTSFINLMAGDTVRLTVPMSTAQTLEAVTVRATVMSVRIRDFEERRRTGSGVVRDSTDIKRYPDLSSVLRTVPNVAIRGRGLKNLVFGIGTPRQCAAIRDQVDFRIDGHPTTVEAVETLDPLSVAAVEVYSRATKLPGTLMTKLQYQCAVWVWTKLGLGR
ncbi:MAG: carboxypeptidase regulatory-like domain-containing protein [Gemmatimonadaceae bacterium]|nr:carboxypeptidase regulatory-like domain-containing protein [Gemmatimonadaceae bacterium]